MNWPFKFEKSGEDVSEKRRHKRYKVKDKSEYLKTRPDPKIEGEGLVFNVSQEGLGMDICDKLGKNCYMIVEIFDSRTNENISVGGQIKWTKNYKDFASCGIHLDWISNEEEYERYLRYLKEKNK